MQYFFTMRKSFAVFLLLTVLLFSVFAEDVAIRKIKVSDSEILTRTEILRVVDECMEKYSGMDLVNAVVDRINGLYREKGFPNALATIPEQTVEDGTVVIRLVEGHVGDITVSGATYTPSDYIVRGVNIDRDGVLNLSVLEKNLLSFNRWNQGVALTSYLNPGKNRPGTTDIDIKVTESFPTGAYATLDNYASEASGSYRAGAHFVANSLTNHRDILLAGAYANFYSRSVYAEYSFPFFLGQMSDPIRAGIRGNYNGSNAAEGSASIFNIKSQTISGAAYLNTVINRTADRNITGTLTGNFNTTTTEAQDTQLTKETLLSGRLSVSSSFIFGNLFLSAEAGATIGFPTESKNDLKTYGKFDAALRATLNLKQIVLSLSASGQWMPFNDLVPNQELMYAGGPTSVRGYMMNCAWGKTAYRASAEVHFMIPKLSRSSIYGFLDHAGVFPYPDVEDNFLLSAGFGAELNIGNIVHLNMNVGLPFWKVYQDKDNPGYKVNLAVTVSTANINV